ncbi:TDP-N-acetylfucosamine:lipid II N-acetylfucosaminyltransferase [Thermomonas brevis]|uniref:TDP-N-acetylfucosamine:lipid II N-acetylfucosaminyltransferase n=1 Tax=Thermomonas brevis TaxID=215691 RepID=A0A7G9QTN8_9GAMM|nr:TDP-N-acetylfucosamine:lipid II N-acetylfucosaminyltransferase [Thermomonas brevis]QNN46713.1 TDP-N-acetylfucosamine:lipid II N-acetylfucosaminyltransferase [Thermomonas brevis]
MNTRYNAADHERARELAATIREAVEYLARGADLPDLRRLIGEALDAVNTCLPEQPTLHGAADSLRGLLGGPLPGGSALAALQRYEQALAVALATTVVTVPSEPAPTLPVSKLLHLVVDDKFIDMAIRDFEQADPGRHEWVVLNGRQPFKYIKDARVRCVDMDGFAQIAAHAAGVVCHTMERRHLAALAVVPNHCCVTWIGWGYDYYGLIRDAFPDGLLMPLTTRLAEQLATRGLVSATQDFAHPYPRATMEEQAALARVDIFSPVLPSEFDIVRRCVPGFRARYLRWNYGNAENDLSLPGATLDQHAPNILVGNSATATNNHLELFDYLHDHVDLAGRQLIVPLSYGDGAYRAAILQDGRDKFGDRFVPLVDFMPRERYIALLRSCGHVMMNHVRQQAFGNLIISGLLGAKLHVNPSSPLHPWLHEQGVPVEAIGGGDLTPLSATARRAQADVFMGMIGRELQLARTKALIGAATGARHSA